MSRTIRELEEQKKAINKEISMLKRKEKMEHYIHEETNNFCLNQINSKRVQLVYRKDRCGGPHVIIYVRERNQDLKEKMAQEIDDLISQLCELKDKLNNS